jgi:hypothetical protein
MMQVTMRHRVALLLLPRLLLAAALPAQQAAPIITVMDFGGSGLAQNELMVFTDYLASHIVQTRRFTVIDRMQRQLMLQEIEFSKSDCTDETCQLEIGRMLSANQIVVGSLGRFGDRFICNIKLIEVETARTANTASKTYASLNELLEDSQNLILSLLRMEAAAAAPAAQPASAPAAAAPAPGEPAAAAALEEDSPPIRNTRLVNKTIRVDGKYEDWGGVEPAILDPAGDKRENVRGTDIIAVYIAGDANFYYLRFLVSDGDFPPSYPGFFQALLSLRPLSGAQLILAAVYEQGWKTQVRVWDPAKRDTTVLAGGTMRRAGPGFEARFPRTLLDSHIKQGTAYSLVGMIGFGNLYFAADTTAIAVVLF